MLRRRSVDDLTLRVELREARQHSFHTEEAPRPPYLARIEGHQLDKANGDGSLSRQLDKGAHLIVVEATHGDDIHFDRRKPQCQNLLEAGEHLLQSGAPRASAEPLRIEGVEADVDAVQARPPQRFGKRGQEYPVGGQMDRLNSRGPDRPLDELQDVTAHQWLPAGVPDLAHPEFRRHTDYAENLGGLQQCVMACEVHPTLGHAVYATKIAAIGHGDPQVVEHPPVPVLDGVAGDFRWGYGHPINPLRQGRRPTERQIGSKPSHTFDGCADPLPAGRRT